MELKSVDSKTIFVLIIGLILGASVFYLVSGGSSLTYFGPEAVSVQDIELSPEKYEGEEVTISGVTEDAGWDYDFKVADSIGYSVGVVCDQAPSDSLEPGIEVTVTGEVVNSTVNQSDEATGDSGGDSGGGDYFYPDSIQGSTGSGYFIECTEPVR